MQLVQHDVRCNESFSVCYLSMLHGEKHFHFLNRKKMIFAVRVGHVIIMMIIMIAGRTLACRLEPLVEPLLSNCDVARF